MACRSMKDVFDLDSLFASSRDIEPLSLITEILERPTGVDSATIVSGDTSLPMRKQEE